MKIDTESLYRSIATLEAVVKIARADVLVRAAAAIRDAFHYDPGHSDLDNEQPIHITTTLGAWRLLDYAIREMERKE